jgi:hypothetical protein
MLCAPTFRLKAVRAFNYYVFLRFNVFMMVMPCNLAHNVNVSNQSGTTIFRLEEGP